MGLANTTSSSPLRLADLPSSVTTPSIQNVTMTFANTEVAVTIPDNTKMIYLAARGNARLQLAYTLGASGTTYITIPAGFRYPILNLKGTSSFFLYIQSSKAGEIVEIESWT